MLHTYRALTVFQHYDARYPQEDFLEEKEWPAACLTSKYWKDVLLFGLQVFGPDLVSQEGVIKTTIYRDGAEIGKLFFTTWYSTLDRCRKYTFYYKDKAHGLYTIRVFEEE